MVRLQRRHTDYLTREAFYLQTAVAKTVGRLPDLALDSAEVEVNSSIRLHH